MEKISNLRKKYFVFLLFSTLALGTFFLFLLLGTSSAHAQSISNPLAVEKAQELIGLIIQTILGVTGSVALFMFVWGGFLWLIAGGEQERVKSGINTMTWATIGLVVIFAAYAILNFIIGSITKPIPKEGEKQDAGGGSAYYERTYMRGDRYDI